MIDFRFWNLDFGFLVLQYSIFPTFQWQGEIKVHLAEVMKKLDHKFLNELDYFSDGNPSSENIAQFVARELQAKIDNSSAQVSRVTAWESDDACATYIVNR